MLFAALRSTNAALLGFTKQQYTKAKTNIAVPFHNKANHGESSRIARQIQQRLFQVRRYLSPKGTNVAKG